MTMTRATHRCELCGELMPASEAAFRFHGYSGPCPKPPIADVIHPGPGELDNLILGAHVDSLKDELRAEREAHQAALNRNQQLRDALEKIGQGIDCGCQIGVPHTWQSCPQYTQEGLMLYVEWVQKTARQAIAG